MSTRPNRDEIIRWATSAIARARAGPQTEDSAVELKSEWIPAHKAARRLAAHANAARGDDILWVIGVNDDGTVCGAGREERAIWWDQVVSRFDTRHPPMQDVAFDHADGPLVALCFDTSESPFVIRTGGNNPEREVPWREGTLTRSAYRHELLSLFEVAVPLPQMSLLGPVVTATVVGSSLEWVLSASLYVHADVERPTIVVPSDCTGEISSIELGVAVALQDVVFLRPAFAPVPQLVEIVDGTAVFRRPASVGFRARGSSSLPAEVVAAPTEDVTYSISVTPRGSRGAVELRGSLPALAPMEGGFGRWVVPRATGGG